VRPDLRAIVVASALSCGLGACSSGSGHALDGADADAGSAGDDAPAVDAASEEALPYDSGSAIDAGNDDGGGAAADAASEASPCVPLGAACTDSTTCLCGAGAGCIVDNVTCSDAGVCALAYSFDAGDTCCAACEIAYDQGGSLAAWTACNDACGLAGCPMRCFAQ
jgi:hypothetical protein